MSIPGEVVVGLVIVVGLVGILVPVLPGAILVLAAIGVWAFQVGSASAWLIFAAGSASTVLAFVVKFSWPGRKLKAAGIPNAALLTGAVLGIIGFFVIPVVGLVIGFVLGIYLYELRRLRAQREAWQSTVHAMKATGLSILVELAGSLIAAALWLVGAIALT